MSLLRKPSKQSNCNSCNAIPDTGAISLQVLPSPTQVKESHTTTALNQQKLLSGDIQDRFFTGMDLKSCDTHMKTCNSEQCMETSYNSKVPLHEVGDMLTQANLTLRVNHMDHGLDSQATCAQVTGEQLNEMLTTGETITQSAGGSFMLHSTDNRTITSVKFYPNID